MLATFFLVLQKLSMPQVKYKSSIDYLGRLHVAGRLVGHVQEFPTIDVKDN